MTAWVVEGNYGTDTVPSWQLVLIFAYEYAAEKAVNYYERHPNETAALEMRRREARVWEDFYIVRTPTALPE